MDTDKAVLTAAIVTVGSTVAFSAAPADLGGRGELPQPRLLIGGGLTFFGLSILGEFAPRVTKGLALSIALTAVTYYGFPVLSNYTNPKPKKRNARKEG